MECVYGLDADMALTDGALLTIALQPAARE